MEPKKNDSCRIQKSSKLLTVLFVESTNGGSLQIDEPSNTEVLHGSPLELSH
jgi:hypothetical protein